MKNNQNSYKEITELTKQSLIYNQVKYSVQTETPG